MKNFLKRFHIMSNQPEDSVEGSTPSRGNRSSGASSPPDMSSAHQGGSEHKALSGLSNWLNSVAQRKSPSPPSSSNVKTNEQSDVVSTSGQDPRRDSGPNNSRGREVEEEYQIQLALELSAKEDPEAAQIEAVKQISLGTSAPENSPAELVAYRYWNYNSLGYDDKILDGFYDLYGILAETNSERIPPLVDLQGIPVSEKVSWEAVLVNRSGDANLLKLEQRALALAIKSKYASRGFVDGDLVRKLAVIVADYMGGPVIDPDNMLRAWRSLSQQLKATLGSMVLPLGSLTIGLARHRALLFKVLADGMGIPCRLVKGLQNTGSDEVAMNFVKVADGREYIVDLMADPGALIPSDATGLHIDYDDSISSTSPCSRDIDSSRIASSSSGIGSSFEEHSEIGLQEGRSKYKSMSAFRNQSESRTCPRPSPNIPSTAQAPDVPKPKGPAKFNLNKEKLQELPTRPSHPVLHGRSPSWTEGVSSPAVRQMKVKDVSQYMIDAAKENPKLAQKLHDVLLESGVVAPPDLFTEIYSDSLDSSVEVKLPTEEKNQEFGAAKSETPNAFNQAQFLPPLPVRKVHFKPQPSPDKPVENVVINQWLDFGKKVSELSKPSQLGASHLGFAQNVPVAVAAAAVVASSMVVAAAKSNTETSAIELPMAAAATASAAAVVATAAAATKLHEPSDGDGGSGGYQPCSGVHDVENDVSGANSEGERLSDRSFGNESFKSDAALEDVAECEIVWDEITLGERIGLGSYGEVYRGDWQGTEVAIKRFLDQDITGESLEEFKSEVRIMKRLRHPNIVLFMGAVTRPPNLSIVTEFLPRGSLYRLIHRPNNQLDERKRLRMALDAARGMNYLHSRNPVVVHRDLKSPNLLVDRNWVVKVCDFGLSRMKHSTYLSSRSTAGTAEWMAPEILRNEPSDEKCDVYSYGVILWELFTMQQPWGKMNAMQVVGAVGFQQRRLDIPDYVDPVIADIINRCWHTDPKQRPTFAEIMASLKRLQKPLTAAQVQRPMPSASNDSENQAG